jgi:signal transduction histidine kinase
MHQEGARDEQARQAEKMQVVAQLAGGIAHDFNNLLMTILGNSEMLTAKLEAGTSLHEMATLIEDAAQRAAELTRRLLAVARRLPLQPRPVDLATFAVDLAERLRPTLDHRIALDVDTVDARPALVDVGALESALHNLVANAQDAMPQGGSLLMATSETAVDAAKALRLGGVEPGRYVTISVTDDGVGMAPEIARRAFEPFFSTKRGGRGRGLGLSTVEGFAAQSGGGVTLVSAPGQGTTVTIHLPAAA